MSPRAEAVRKAKIEEIKVDRAYTEAHALQAWTREATEALAVYSDERFWMNNRNYRGSMILQAFVQNSPEWMARYKAAKQNAIAR